MGINHLAIVQGHKGQVHESHYDADEQKIIITRYILKKNGEDSEATVEIDASGMASVSCSSYDRLCRSTRRFHNQDKALAKLEERKAELMAIYQQDIEPFEEQILAIQNHDFDAIDYGFGGGAVVLMSPTSVKYEGQILPESSDEAGFDEIEYTLHKDTVVVAEPFGRGAMLMVTSTRLIYTVHQGAQSFIVEVEWKPTLPEFIPLPKLPDGSHPYEERAVPMPGIQHL